MHYARSGAAETGATATLLGDGRVLIVGGGDRDEYLASAEIYDPATGTFSVVGSMHDPRQGHTATLLQDGRVLIVGGDNSAGYLSSAELYEPTTGRFSPTGSLAAARSSHTATLRPDGKVLIAGGDEGIGEGVGSPNTGPSSIVLASAELYDPATGRFSPAGSMKEARTGQTATLLPDGHVLLIGGLTSMNKPIASAEIYDPSSGAFSLVARLSAARWQPASVLLADGRVLVCGGRVNIQGMPITAAEIFDPATLTFRKTGSLTIPREWETATLLPNGWVLIAAGDVVDLGVSDATGSSSTEIYDPAIGEFHQAAHMTAWRQHQTATVLPSGLILFTGGDSVSGVLSSAELYRP